MHQKAKVTFSLHCGPENGPPLEGNCPLPLANISAENCSQAFRELHQGRGRCKLGASAALSGTAGRSRSWSVPGQGLAHAHKNKLRLFSVDNLPYGGTPRDEAAFSHGVSRSVIAVGAM